MVFESILFLKAEDSPKQGVSETPEFLSDLNLDQIIDAVTKGNEEYNLKPFYYALLGDADSINYRYEIFQELEDKQLNDTVELFAIKMRTMREYLALSDKLYYKYQKERWFLEAVWVYCEAVSSLLHELSLKELKSRGFLAFRAYLTDYVNSAYFSSLQSETKKLLADLSSVKYTLLIEDNNIIVRNYESLADYSAEIEETFKKFKQGAAHDYRINFSDAPEMNHVEAGVLDLVVQLYPEVFANLNAFSEKNKNYLDKKIADFDREIRFYVSYSEHIALFKHSGLNFCYAQITNTDKGIFNYQGFDLALAYKLIKENSSIVCNDYYLKDKERIFVISGPNQSGKTTFARSFGQLHYLANLGCPVPGKEARLFLFDNLFTHFEREENIVNLHGKLQDDLMRIHDILSKATPNSIVIMNEIFTSTTVKNAVFLGKKILERIIQLDLLCVCVTFLD